MIVGVINLNFFNFVGKMYVVCAMLRNALTCLYKNRSAMRTCVYCWVIE